MKRRKITTVVPAMLLVLCGRPLASAEATEAPEDPHASLVAGIPHFVDEIMVRWGVPGVAVSVVRRDEVLFAGGFGVRDLESREEVDADTSFAIGSLTKSFTALTVGALVDQGLVQWDQPVRSYLPDFSLQDPVTTLHATPRDLLAHRTGLKRHDAVWYRSTARREELFSVLRYLEPWAGFRERFSYSSLMYMVAGILVERVSGESWEAAVSRRIFEPLGMSRSTFEAPAVGDANAAKPHIPSADGKAVEIPIYEGWAAGPAGSIFSTANDLGRWLQYQLGARPEGSPTSLATLRETQQPQMVVDRPATLAFPMTSYGLGWYVQVYRGRLFLWHSGNIDGYYSLLGFLPDEDLGIVVLSNRSEHQVPEVVSRWVIDRFLGLVEIDWHGQLLGQERLLAEQAAAAHVRAVEMHENSRGEISSVEAYVGSYRHPAYGELRVSSEEGELNGEFHGIAGRILHLQGDLFLFEASGEIFRDIFFQLSFGRDTTGRIVSVASPLADGVSPIVFLRIAPEDAAASPPG